MLVFLFLFVFCFEWLFVSCSQMFKNPLNVSSIAPSGFRAHSSVPDPSGQFLNSIPIVHECPVIVSVTCNMSILQEACITTHTMLHNAGYYVTLMRVAHRPEDWAWEQLVTTQEEEKGRASALKSESGTLKASGPITYPLSLKPQFPDLSCGRQEKCLEAEIACTCPAQSQWAASSSTLL